ncbi:DNA-binding response regulator, NarL/FixJ family, contains REC and HTH domains [Lentzea albidocapillata subsp. violacea]|uniref:DNA-binding response regulator, NarL/FixJ family, contains REC and HTH domains n=1 Tax=Lentzea albidocapillata subsp. violacea TaxID=128104 RepID=A0A1G9KHX7_9PSEU|nr:DNA-binding response regulator, NarL/FixJ family, contains REC and HTH domains [Lentzea albidocapillata subsp. violacea]
MPNCVRSKRIAVHSRERLTTDAVASWLDALPGWLVVGTAYSQADLLLLCRLRPPDVVVGQLEPESLPEIPLVRLCPASGLASLRTQLERISLPPQRRSGPGALTDREMEVLAHVCSGLSAAQLAAVLRLSPHTVVNYKRRIFTKLGVQSRVQAAAVVSRLGLVRSSCSVPAAHENVPTLTHREHDILDSIARGESVRQTAHALGIAVKTVESEQRQLFFKLRVHNRSQALSEAQRLGLLT